MPSVSTNKKNIKTISVIVSSLTCLLSLSLFGCSQIELLTIKEKTIEYGEQISQDPMKYFSDSLAQEDKEKLKDNVTLSVIGIDKQKEYQDVGQYTIEISYKNNKNIVLVNIVDKTKPVFVKKEECIEIWPNEVIDFESFFDATDLSEFQIMVDDSDVKYDVPGEYAATISAIDIYDNEAFVETKIKIKQPEVILDEKELILNIGETKKINATINGKDTVAKFSSSDEKVARIDDNGELTALKSGKASITIAANNVSETCNVIVKEQNQETKPSDNQKNNNSNVNQNNPTSSISKTTNIPSGGTISIPSFEIVEPKESNFGKYYSFAKQIYDGMIN